MNLKRLAPAENSKILVVGGCGGIGKALIKACIENNLCVAILDLQNSIDENPIPEKVEIIIPIDASKENQVIDAFNKIKSNWKSIEHLVFLSGFTTELISVENLSTQQFDELFDGNFKSAFYCCKYALPLLKKSEKPSIVTISSDIGRIGQAGYLGYGVAKNGIMTLTKALARENSPKLRANCVVPGPVRTPFLSKGTGRGGKENDKASRVNIDQLNAMTPLGRIAEPEDIVGAILFLMSDAASFITGQNLNVNGGMLMI